MSRLRAALLLTAALTAVLSAGLLAQAPTEKGRLGLALTDIMKPWTGDLDGMVERRMIRILTTYSRTQYFIDRGTPRGTAYDQGKLLENELNTKLKTGNLTIQVQFIPLSRDELMPALLEGKGDVVMADLTVTPERAERVDFTEPWIAGVDEIVVTSPTGPVIASVDDLSGKESVRQTVEQLSPEPGRSERPVCGGRQGARDDRSRTGGDGRRRPARDGQRRPRADPRRGQPQGVVLAAGLSPAEALPRGDAPQGWPDCVGGPEGQPAAL
jgi:hypothetical protein